jgi:aminoglycoside 6'-N-acetyltransferase I
MRIRPMEPKDRQEWIRLRLALWPDHGEADLAREAAEIAADPAGHCVFFAEDSAGQLVGLAEGRIRPIVDGCRTQTVGYLEGWYVAPQHRRKGIGRDLVEAIEAWARAKGCRELASDCELDNELSRAAHISIGFEETLRLIHFRRELR